MPHIRAPRKLPWYMPLRLSTSAASSSAFLHSGWPNDNLPFHSPVSETTSVAALERVRAGRLCQKLDRRRFAFLKLPTLLRRDKDQPRFATRFGAVGNGCDFEPMVVVCGGDFELHFGADLNTNRRGRILVLLRGEFDDLRLLILRLSRARSREKHGGQWKNKKHGPQEPFFKCRQ